MHKAFCAIDAKKPCKAFKKDLILENANLNTDFAYIFVCYVPLKIEGVLCILTQYYVVYYSVENKHNSN